MQVKDIVDILKCQVLIEGDLEQEVKTACGSDMMSDVLAFVKDQAVLLTGLMNQQVIRTAEMMDPYVPCEGRTGVQGMQDPRSRKVKGLNTGILRTGGCPVWKGWHRAVPVPPDAACQRLPLKPC